MTKWMWLILCLQGCSFDMPTDESSKIACHDFRDASVTRANECGLPTDIVSLYNDRLSALCEKPRYIQNVGTVYRCVADVKAAACYDLPVPCPEVETYIKL